MSDLAKASRLALSEPMLVGDTHKLWSTEREAQELSFCKQLSPSSPTSPKRSVRFEDRDADEFQQRRPHEIQQNTAVLLGGGLGPPAPESEQQRRMVEQTAKFVASQADPLRAEQQFLHRQGGAEIFSFVRHGDKHHSYYMQQRQLALSARDALAPHFRFSTAPDETLKTSARHGDEPKVSTSVRPGASATAGVNQGPISGPKHSLPVFIRATGHDAVESVPDHGVCQPYPAELNHVDRQGSMHSDMDHKPGSAADVDKVADGNAAQVSEIVGNRSDESVLGAYAESIPLASSVDMSKYADAASGPGVSSTKALTPRLDENPERWPQVATDTSPPCVIPSPDDPLEQMPAVTFMRRASHDVVAHGHDDESSVRGVFEASWFFGDDAEAPVSPYASDTCGDGDWWVIEGLDVTKARMTQEEEECYEALVNEHMEGSHSKRTHSKHFLSDRAAYHETFVGHIEGTVRECAGTLLELFGKGSCAQHPLACEQRCVSCKRACQEHGNYQGFQEIDALEIDAPSFENPHKECSSAAATCRRSFRV